MRTSAPAWTDAQFQVAADRAPSDSESHEMTFKTLSSGDAARIAALPLDYEWDSTIGNGFVAATDETHPRLAAALEALNIHGAADLALGAAEWCIARVQDSMPAEDGRSRLQSAWAATVDRRYSRLAGSPPRDVAPDDVWTLPEWRVRRSLMSFVGFLEEGWTSKVRQTALGMVLLAEHVCGRDAAFGPWLTNMLRTKTASSPRHADDRDYTSSDLSLPTSQELTAPSREERLADLDPATNPYLRSAADMAALGFVGNPYQRHP